MSRQRAFVFIHLFGLLAAGSEPLRHQELRRDEPRPLCIQVLQFDLQAEDYALGVAIGADPDGDGPAEAMLTRPQALAAAAGFIAAINCNAWSMVPPPPEGQPPVYLPGRGCDIISWAETDGQRRSEPQHAYWCVWQNEAGQVQIGPAPEQATARLAVAGFGGLIDDGRIMPAPSEVRHPRTAAGIDRSGRWLTLMVVDGRQPGYSEGVSTCELAELMLAQGCWRALNLDGGGSSIMLLADASGELEILNRPSDLIGARAIPVMLGIVRRPH